MIQCPKCSADNSDDSRFCKSCGQEISSLSQAPTVAAPEGESPPSPVNAPHVGRIVSSDSVPAGGFTPGTILADRYRIIGLLGRGGMGEVYRADDLKLGQPVALKFLPPKLADDPVRRERFFAEVRITRQLSHPNICRVYDIGEVDVRHFLSMEYIDGEDLASLMKRIGHLSNEKALDIARQLVAGLSVAHERGVLHRDLKPANIMLDGHGRVRITDFGLAIAVEDESQAEEIAGTPAYMAPEQLAGKGATVRSDIYSLGLILYEIYTGKKAFKAKTLAELREQKETQTPRAPSEIRDGIDPVVERVIQRCMEKDPNARPASVAQLAQALPGGDPLAAAIAAGETPSPEMVAASGSKEGLRPWIAWTILLCIILGALGVLAMKDHFNLERRIQFNKRPEVLVERSRDIIKKLGYSDEYVDCAYGFERNSQLLQNIQNENKKIDRWKDLDSNAILFWYRQSPRTLGNIDGAIEPDNPELKYSGEILIVLDTEGRLIKFCVVPPQEVPSTEASAEFDWSVLFTEASIDILQWTEIESQWTPPFYADNTAAWKCSSPGKSTDAVRIEVAAFRNKAVYFEIIYPWTLASRMESVPLRLDARIALLVFIPMCLIATIGGIYFALRNLRQGRGDRRNATRLAVFLTCLAIVALVLRIPRISVSFRLLIPWLAGLVWILYIAIEPYVRRRWPQVLVTWTRILSGEWRDPLVARDAFVGILFGIVATCVHRSGHTLIPTLLSFAEIEPPFSLSFDAAISNRLLISGFLDTIIFVILIRLVELFTLFLMRMLLRNQKAAVAVCIVLFATASGPLNIPCFATLLVNSCLTIYLLMRFGLLACIFSGFSSFFLTSASSTLQASAWYAPNGFFALAIFAAIVLYAFHTSLGGRPLFGTPRLDE